MTKKYHYQCTDCSQEFHTGEALYLCPSCRQKNEPGTPPRGVLKTIYHYDRIRGKESGKELFDRLRSEKFLPLLPLRTLNSWPRLRIGDTPLYTWDVTQGLQTGCAPDRHGNERESGKPEIFLKDDSQNPTFSFKDRASALVSAWAAENNTGILIAASTGNAGSSLAGICASQRQKSIIVVPAAAPPAKLTQILMYGATLIPVSGTYDDAFALSVKLTEKYGWYNRNTAFNPLTIEGKKTVSFEIFGQLGYRVPDRIFIPVGDGVIFSGVCKGFEDLLKLGIITKMPEAVAVQSAGSSNLVSNLDRFPFTSAPSKTVADSISVDVPQCFNMTAKYIREYNGETVTVTDEEILGASVRLSRSTGIFSEPAASAAFAGMLKYLERGLIPAGSRNVVLLTGSGLKDLGAVSETIRIPQAVDPDPDSAGEMLKKMHLIP